MKANNVMRLVSVLALGVSVQAGVIDLLKGETPQAPMQRVAFVGSAVVKEVQGEAERLIGIDRWTHVQQGAELQPGDIIRTGQGTVVLRMKDSGSFVKVTPRTMLRLVRFEQGWDRGILSGREEQEGFVVRACRGKAQARDGAGDWQFVTVNSVLAEGAQLKLAPGATLDLYSTREQRPLRLEGASEAILNAGVFPRAKAPAIAALGR